MAGELKFEARAAYSSVTLPLSASASGGAKPLNEYDFAFHELVNDDDVSAKLALVTVPTLSTVSASRQLPLNKIIK